MVKRGRKSRSRRSHRGGEGLTGRKLFGGEGLTGRTMSGGEGLTGRTMSGGEGLTGRTMSGGGSPLPLTPGAYSTDGQPYTPSQYYTQSAGRRKRRSLSRKTKKGGSVLATAAVPFGLLALQRYFMGSKTAKKGVRNMGRSVKRTFRRHRGGAEGIPFAVPPSS
jgi:hypothetical protein